MTMNEANDTDRLKKPDNRWAWGISIVFLLFTALIILTVKIATVDYPVEMDNHFRQDYHYVDANINELKLMSGEFDAQGFKLYFPEQLKLGTNRFSFILQDFRGEPVTDASLNLLVTREATTKDDIEAGQLIYKNSKYHSEPVVLDKPGAWILNVEVKLAKLTIIRKTHLTIPFSNDDISHQSGRINARARKASLGK